MCCITEQAFSEKAEKDIYVYKLFCVKHGNKEDSLESPLYSNRTYHVGDKNIPCGWFEKDVTGELNLGTVKGTYRVSYGFHSFKNKNDAFKLYHYLKNTTFYGDYVVCLCRINKGTEIFFGYGQMTSAGQYECYVSEKIDILRNVDVTE